MTVLRTVLADLYDTYRRELPDVYRWEDENERWHELVYCALAADGQSPALKRHVVASLGQLGLLGFDDLATAVTAEGRLDQTNPHVLQLVELLVRNGIAESSSTESLLLVSKVARRIRAEHGSMSRFLRSHGERLLTDLLTFSGSGSSDRAPQVFAAWLQSAMELPMPIGTTEILAFCKQNACSIEELVDAADELGINVAVVDDLITLSRVPSPPAVSQPPAL